MPLVDLKIAAGFYTEQTERGALNHWKDGERIRFRYGLPEKLAGWLPYRDTFGTPMAVQPPVRAEHDWSSLDNQLWLALASDKKLYVINNDTLYDITPIQSSGTLTNPFTTSAGQPDVMVAHVEHGLVEGQVVNYSGATPVGGLTLNGEYVVTSVPDPDNYFIAAPGATSSATGGGTVNYQYEIAPPIGSSAMLGWGIGPYGLDNDPNYIGNGWGTARNAINLRSELPLWSLDNWGQDLMACRRGGPIYVWERANGPGTRARVIPNAPVASNWILVSPEDRILISYGSHDGGQRDQSLIRWTAREDYNDWTPSEGNAAGDKRIDSGSRILSAVRTRNETIIWTDTSIYSQSSDPTDVFQFQPKGESLSIVGPNAAVEVGGVVYFMAKDEFVRYDGVSQIIPCTVRNYIFGRIDRDKLENVYASVNKEQSEVWWFYSSNGAADNDSYVIYNYRENIWYYGTLARTAYTDTGFIDNPIAVSPMGALYRHEVGYEYRDEEVPAFIESYAMEILDVGEYFGHVDKFIPDFLSLDGAVKMTFETRQYPAGVPIVKGPYQVDAATRKIDFRSRGRQISVRIEDVVGMVRAAWRYGTFRINVRQDGKR